MSFTLVSLHAHPDDEALLTGGTLARAAAEGHRVVLVVATDGEAGLTAAAAAAADLAAIRRAELQASACALGVARVVFLGYPDSGMAGSAPDAFCDQDVAEVAERVAGILREEGAHVLTGYDPAGGYGHPDHVQVHRVARAAAQRAQTPVLLEATVDRTAMVRATAVLRQLSRVLPMPHVPDMTRAFSDRAEITHRVGVRPHLTAKRAALRAHTSQGTGGPRTVRLLLALPPPWRGWVLGQEWFVEVGRAPGPVLDDIFATLR